jgi:tRNA-uridine 2-sulfurtransferase
MSDGNSEVLRAAAVVAVPTANLDNKRVVIGMSGGVDSSVAAWLLKEQGYEVIGLFMKNWEDDDDQEYCSTRQDFLDAASAADVVGVELQAVNFAVEYKDRVFAEFLREYSVGRTPNPDVLCNAEIKFKAFLDHAMSLGAAKIATGHYARVREVRGPESVTTGQPSQFELLRGLDATKDQSYFLHRLTQDQLARSLFPVGHLPKTQVREIAKKIGLPNAAKKDSTGICFIGERPFREFLNRYLAQKPGKILDDSGRVIGQHVGLSFYTLGQRKGIGLGGSKDSSGQAWYVARKDIERNELHAVQGHNHPWLLSHRLEADDLSWVAGEAPDNATLEPSLLGAKTRYRQQDAPCSLHTQNGSLSLSFVQPQWAVTPGQSAVLYHGDVCLGGGVIAAASSS